jgi:hypothetical protein
MSYRVSLDDRWPFGRLRECSVLLPDAPEYCKLHGEELPCAECLAQRRVRERDAHRREHEPLRHPKVLEVK